MKHLLAVFKQYCGAYLKRERGGFRKGVPLSSGKDLLQLLVSYVVNL